MSVIAAPSETLLWWAVVADAAAVPFAIIIHILLSGILFLAVLVVHKERTSLALLAAGTLFMGPFGAVGSLAMVLFASSTGKGDFKSYRLALGPQTKENVAHIVISADQSGGGLISFHDVMRWGTRQEKQFALRRIAERYSPAFASALKLALRDSIPEVRSEGGAAANAILKEMENRARDLAARTAHNTNGRDGLALLVGYGDAELAVASSGLASPQRSDQARRAALAAFDEVLRHMPENADIRLKSARALFDSGVLIEAARESRKALKLRSGEHEREREALSLYLESLFALEQYDEIRRVLAQFPDANAGNRATKLWSESVPIRRDEPSVPRQTRASSHA